MAGELYFLYPYDKSKELVIQTDGFKMGLEYILFQEGGKPPPPPSTENSTDEEKKEGWRKCLGRVLIQLGATGLTPEQKNWSRLDIELLGTVWINVRTDQKIVQ